MVHLGDVNPSVWDEIVEVMEEKLKHIEFQEEDITFNWRIPADSKRLDRELYETYGMFKDIILHPQFQYCKQIAEENVNFDFVLGDSMMPLATAVIVLFMLHKRVSNNIIALAAAFIFNVNPLYVCLIVFTWWLTKGGNKKPKLFNPKNRRSAKNVPTEPKEYSSNFTIGSEYEHVLIGNDLSTLYTAALLSKNGHKCCILQPKSSPPNSCHPAGAPHPIVVANPSVGKVDRYQSLLDIVQSSDSQERVSFVPVGSAEDCFTHTVLRVANIVKAARGVSFSVWPLRAGAASLALDISSRLHTEKAVLVEFFRCVVAAQTSVTGYLITKIGLTPGVPAAATAAVGDGFFSSTAGETTATRADGLAQFLNLSTSSAEQILSRIPDLDESMANILSAACTVGSEEALSAADCSGYALAALLTNTENGMFFPRGGYKALEGALVRAVRTAGGEVYCGVPIKEIRVEEVAGIKKAVGVQISGDENSEIVVKASRSVVSGAGALCTYTRLVRASCVSDGVRTGLSSLVESRPKVLVLVWLTGSILDLGLSSTDYVEVCPTSPFSAHDANSLREQYAGSYIRIWSPSAKDPLWGQQHSEATQAVIVELEAGDPLVTVQKHKYAAAPATATSSAVEVFLSTVNVVGGPILYGGGDDKTAQGTAAPGACSVGYPAAMSKSQTEKARLRAVSKLTEVFPLTEGKISFSYVLPPTLGGGRVAGLTTKYASPGLTATSDISGLFLCGRDVSTSGIGGDIQGGWMAANAALGYVSADLSAGRNIASDLQRVKR